ncbi:MAG TPA: hypothetical protein VKD22_15115 [Ramlibacter sp.]|nr:hypothetical protein [Ramlibacter sp.]
MGVDVESGLPKPKKKKRVGLRIYQPTPIVSFVGHSDDISRMCPVPVMIKTVIGCAGILGILFFALLILSLVGLISCSWFRPFCIFQ